MAENTLYFGDNLNILREHIGDDTVDLIYLDPPFNSKANYNVLFRSPKGHESNCIESRRRRARSICIAIRPRRRTLYDVGG
ncbi:MAG TPA: hypothetical protein VE863_11845 [Pyrinomonadaceae bacterium]|nr:hypothetical protein [Pyrinomonadaceae bacterium]